MSGRQQGAKPEVEPEVEVEVVFGAHHDGLGAHFLQSEDAVHSATPAEVLALIDAVGGSLGCATTTAVPPQSFPDVKLLDETARSALMHRVDEHYLTTVGDGPNSTDVRLALSETELEQLVGPSAARRLFDHFGARPTDIRLRRVEASGDDPVCLPFHADYSKRTMQVALNDPHEYDGGSLVWILDGALDMPPRPAGSATIHTKDVMHAVTRMTRGIRYGLFLCEMPEQSEVDLLHPIDPAVEQMEAQQEGEDMEQLTQLQLTLDAPKPTRAQATTGDLGSPPATSAPQPHRAVATMEAHLMAEPEPEAAAEAEACGVAIAAGGLRSQSRHYSLILFILYICRTECPLLEDILVISFSCLTPPVSQEHEQAAAAAHRARATVSQPATRHHSHHHLHVLTPIRVGAE